MAVDEQQPLQERELRDRKIRRKHLRKTCQLLDPKILQQMGSS